MSASKTVGHYTLVEKLGQGSYATVYKAHHKSQGGTFAVKVISREKIKSTRLQANLEQEIRIMKEVTHENVVRLYETFTSKNNIYLVLEFCGGGDLQHFVRKQRRLKEDVAKNFFIQIVRGLKFLHSKNVIHRDIKPQNLLLSEYSPNATIKFADFGFAKYLQEASMAQTPCGTPLYMAPEIFEMKEYDAKADVWSIGCVLFEMCTGEPPFKGSNHRELFMSIRSRSLRLPQGLTLSKEVMDILARILEISPERRLNLDVLYEATEQMAKSEQGYTERQTEAPDAVSGSGHIGTSPDRFAGVQQGSQGELHSGDPSNSKSNYAEGSGKESRKKTVTIEDNYPSPSSGSWGSPHQHEGNPLRRVRSRDMSQGRNSPIAGSNHPEGSNTANAMTPATATMLVKLANPGTSPSEKSVSDYANISPGSAGKSSAVSKALSTNIDANDVDERIDVRGVSQQSSGYRTGSQEEGKGHVRATQSGNNSFHRSLPASPSPPNDLNPNAGGSGSDDFVMIEEPSSSSASYGKVAEHHRQNSSGVSSIVALQQKSNKGTGEAQGVGGGVWTDSSTTEQSGDALYVSECMHRCQYIASIVTTMTKHADQLVKDVFAKYGKLISRELNREGEAALDSSRTCETAENEEDAGEKVPSRRHRSSTTSSDSSGSLVEANLQAVSTDLTVPFSFYLHAMSYIQDAMQRTVALKTMLTESKRDSNVKFCHQLDALVDGLRERFDQLMARAEGCQRWIRSDATFPIPEPIIYEAALKLGQEAAVEELLGNLKVACDHYLDAKLLVECVLLSASEAADRRVLQGYAKMFFDQFTLCKESSTLLEYDGKTAAGKSADHKSFSPGSNCSVDSQSSR